MAIWWSCRTQVSVTQDSSASTSDIPIVYTVMSDATSVYDWKDLIPFQYFMTSKEEPKSKSKWLNKQIKRRGWKR